VHSQTHRQHCDLISLLFIYLNNKIRLTNKIRA
jgi:hypothetical protein